MLRRSYLKSVLGTIVAASVAPRLLEPVSAAQPSGLRDTVPATLPEALNSGTSDAAVAFILQHTRVAAASTSADKAALLRLVASDQSGCAKFRPQREHAALMLLQPVAGSAADLTAIARGFGGAARVRALLPGIQSKELKTILVQTLDIAP
jgi:hypothetical protein